MEKTLLSGRTISLSEEEKLDRYRYWDIPVIQRDLEDQIKEEKEKQLKQKQMSKEIKISEVVALLKTGHSRLQKDDLGDGSIQAKYSLSFSECKQLFSHPKLRGIKRSKPSLVIIDDTTSEDTVSVTNSPEDDLFN